MIKLWRPDDGLCMETLYGHRSTVTSLYQMADGRLMSTSTQRHIIIWTRDIPSSPSSSSSSYRIESRRMLSSSYDTMLCAIELKNAGLIASCSGMHVQLWRDRSYYPHLNNDTRTIGKPPIHNWKGHESRGVVDSKRDDDVRRSVVEFRKK